MSLCVSVFSVEGADILSGCHSVHFSTPDLLCDLGANVRVLLHRFKVGLRRFAVGIRILIYGQSVYMIPAGAPWMLCRDPLA